MQAVNAAVQSGGHRVQEQGGVPGNDEAAHHPHSQEPWRRERPGVAEGKDGPEGALQQIPGDRRSGAPPRPHLTCYPRPQQDAWTVRGEAANRPPTVGLDRLSENYCYTPPCAVLVFLPRD